MLRSWKYSFTGRKLKVTSKKIKKNKHFSIDQPRPETNDLSSNIKYSIKWKLCVTKKNHFRNHDENYTSKGLTFTGQELPIGKPIANQVKTTKLILFNCIYLGKCNMYFNSNKNWRWFHSLNLNCWNQAKILSELLF